MRRPLLLLAVLPLLSSCETWSGSDSPAKRSRFEWSELPWVVTQEQTTRDVTGREILVRYFVSRSPDNSTNPYFIHDGDRLIGSSHDLDRQACEAIDVATGKTVLEFGMHRLEHLPGTGWLYMQAEQLVSTPRNADYWLERGLSKNFRSFHLDSGPSGLTDVRRVRIHTTAMDGRKLPKGRSRADIDAKDRLQTIEITYGPMIFDPVREAQPGRRVEMRAMDGSTLLDLPVKRYSTSVIGDDLASYAVKDGELRLALTNFGWSDLHWTPPGTRKFWFLRGAKSHEVICAPVPGLSVDEDLWLPLQGDRSFAAPPGIMGFQPILDLEQFDQPPSERGARDYVARGWLTRFVLPKNAAQNAPRWGVANRDLTEWSGAQWCEVHPVRTTIVKYDDYNKKLADGEDVMLVCKTPAEDWAGFRAGKNTNLVRAVREGGMAHWAGTVEELYADIEADYERTRISALEYAVYDSMKRRDLNDVAKFGTQSTPRAIMSAYGYFGHKASEQMLATVHDTLRALGAQNEAAKVAAAYNVRRNARIAEEERYRAQVAAASERAEAARRARNAARRTTHQRTQTRTSSSTAWSPGIAPAWKPSPQQQWNNYKHNLDVQIRSVLDR